MLERSTDGPADDAENRVLLIVFFFFKQKTAYDIGWCDWSSDVCSSDLALGGVRRYRGALPREGSCQPLRQRRYSCARPLSSCAAHADSGPCGATPRQWPWERLTRPRRAALALSLKCLHCKKAVTKPWSASGLEPRAVWIGREITLSAGPWP